MLRAILTGAEGVREFFDEIGHLDGDDYDGETDELDGEFERAVLSPDHGGGRLEPGRVQDAEQQERLDGQEAGEDGGGRRELFHGGDSRCTKTGRGGDE